MTNGADVMGQDKMTVESIVEWEDGETSVVVLVVVVVGSWNRLTPSWVACVLACLFL